MPASRAVTRSRARRLSLIDSVKVATWREVPERTPVGATVEGIDLVIIRRGDEHSVLYGRCLHPGALLCDGHIEGDDLARCRPTTRGGSKKHLEICGVCESVLEQFRAVIRMTGALSEDDVDSLTPAQRDPVMAEFRDWASARS